MGDLYKRVVEHLEDQGLEKEAANEYSPSGREMSGMYAGADLPADGMLVKMIKSDPEAAKYWQMAVEKVFHKFQNMQEEMKDQIPTQGDMARMFNDPAMSEMGTTDEGMGEDPMEGQPSDLPEGTVVDEAGNPVAPEEEQGPVGDVPTEQAPEGAPVPEEAAEGEPQDVEEDEAEEEEMYPFGQRDKKKKKKKKSKVSDSEAKKKEPREETPVEVADNEAAPKVASASLAAELHTWLMTRD